MNKYMKMKTTELRSKLAKKLRDGSITENGQRPTNPSKVFRLTNKETAVAWLESNCITWSNYHNDGSIFTEDSDSKGGSGNPPQKPTDTEDDPRSKDDEQSDSPPEIDDLKNIVDSVQENLDSSVDYNIVTTKGVLPIKQLDEDLQINQRLHTLADFTGFAIQQTKSAYRVLNNRIDEINEFGGGGETIININDKEVKRSDKVHYHPKFEQICNYSKWYGNVMLVGEAGTGKTTVAEQVAKSLDLQFKHLSCSAGMSEAQILGRMVFDGTYIPSDFVEIYENGGVFLFDEFDAMDGNCAVVINSALANGKMSVPNRKENPTAIRHKDCMIIVACNTFGTGYGGRVYAGRNKLDGATLDRFCSSTIYFTYDKKLERKLCGHKALCEALWELRKRVAEYKLDEKIISTRLFYNGNIAMTNGESIKSFFETLTVKWTKEEKAKCDVDGIIRNTESEVK